MIGSTLALGFFASSVYCQDVHKMEILNGSTRTVHYFADRATPQEHAALAELTRLENESALADELVLLRRQYVNDERLFEAHRTNVQRLLYGYSTQYSAGLYPEYWPGYGWNWGWGGYSFGNWGGGLGVYPYLYGGYYGTSSRSLAHGVGDEGRIKTEMARTLAAQATPGYAAEVNQALQKVRSSADLPKSLRGSR
jgi:hypothetical protein